MKLEDKISVIEAVIFASGDPIEAERICEAAQIEDVDMLDKLVKLLNDRYENTDSALRVLKLDNCYQLATKTEYAPFVKVALETKRNAALSQAALEALTIVAYNQPVTKSFVEQVRGVDSSGVINSLVEKDLLEEAGRLDLPGRPVAYKTTNNFLRCFQIESIDELPPLPNHDDQMTIDEISDVENASDGE